MRVTKPMLRAKPTMPTVITAAASTTPSTVSTRARLDQRRAGGILRRALHAAFHRVSAGGSRRGPSARR